MSNMVVQTNVLALNAHRNLSVVGSVQAQASARLSSGYRINTAADDAAGLAISEKMRSQIRGLDQASRNAQDAQSLAQTAEGGMTEIGDMLQRMRELVVQAQNDTNNNGTDTAGGTGNTGDRQKIQDELDQLANEIDGMTKRTQFNGKQLIDGSQSAADALYFQVGANQSQSITLSIANVDSNSLGIGTGDGTSGATKIQVVDPSGKAIDAKGYLDTIDSAISLVNSERSKLGAVENRLDYTMKSLDISSENISAAESRVRDTDMAKEMMNLTKTNVLQQAGVSMLAQANQSPQSILKLLG